MVHFLREKNSKSENDSKIYDFSSTLFDICTLKKLLRDIFKDKKKKKKEHPFD